MEIRIDYNKTSQAILDASIHVHRLLGPGLLESVYEVCLARELTKRGISFESQVLVPICYEQELTGKAFRIDLLVEQRIIVELKAVEVLLPIHYAQVLSYLRLSHHKLGLLINFNVPLLKDGFHRIVTKEFFQ